MKPENIEKIHESFAQQAAEFEKPGRIFSKKEYLDYIVASVNPDKEDVMLEAAAGTCAVSRAFAPYVKTVVSMDGTPVMLETGRKQAYKEGHRNIIFTKGFVEDIPFLDGFFDIVISRLAFHHFTDPNAAFHEMARVVKPGGRLVLVDMAATPEPDRTVRDEFEILRDPSHVRNLSEEEMVDLFKGENLSIEVHSSKTIPQDLEGWMDVTHTPEDVRKVIRTAMETELSGGKKTGFAPYRKENGIGFDHKWILITGRK